MPKKIEPMLPLQELDMQVFNLKKEREKLMPQLKQYEENLTNAKARLDAIKSKSKELKVKIAEKELNLKDMEEKIHKLNIQANAVRKNEEYQAIMKEIQGIKSDKSVLEDQILELYTSVDAANEEERNAQAEVKKAEEELSKDKKRIEGDIAKLDAKISEISAKRASITESIAKEALAQYERILAAKEDGVAIAKISSHKQFGEESYTCQSCMADITVQEINLLMQGRDLIFCRSCSRILHIE